MLVRKLEKHLCFEVCTWPQQWVEYICWLPLRHWPDLIFFLGLHVFESINPLSTLNCLLGAFCLSFENCRWQFSTHLNTHSSRKVHVIWWTSQKNKKTKCNLWIGCKIKLETVAPKKQKHSFKKMPIWGLCPGTIPYLPTSRPEISWIKLYYCNNVKS